MNRKLILASALTIALCTVALPGPAARADETPTTAPASTTPEKVLGKWIYGSVSPLTYWDSDTGKFLGNARGSGEVLIFEKDGTYKQYTYIESRMYNMVTRCWTNTEGKVEFAGDSLTLRPTKGHYLASGTREIDRDMTEQELKDNVRHYKWKLEQDDEGRPLFIIPFDDGSMFRYSKVEE